MKDKLIKGILLLIFSAFPIMYGIFNIYDAILENNKQTFIASMMIFTGGIIIFCLITSLHLIEKINNKNS